MALPAAGEFGRVKRSGDTMRNNLKFIDVTNPLYQSIVEFIAAIGGPLVGGIRLNGNDLEFYDSTVLAWVKLSQLTGHLGDIYYVTPAPGQFVFNLPFSYVIGSNTLQVELVGVSRVPGPGAAIPIYAETLPNQVTFLGGPGGIAPWTPFVGTEILIFFVPGRPVVNDAFTVKGDAADAAPNYLDTKVTASGAAVATSPGSPANTLRNIDVPFAIGVPPASAGAGAVGVSARVAREDHQHPVPVVGPYLYDEATNGAGFVAGPGPNHVITIAAGTYPMGINALVVFHNGGQIPYSKLTELTNTTYQINGLGPLAAADIVTTRIPAAASPPATVGQGAGFSNVPASPFFSYNWGLGTRRLSIFVSSVRSAAPNRGHSTGKSVLDVVTGQIDGTYNQIAMSGADAVVGINKIAAAGDVIASSPGADTVTIQAINLVTRTVAFACTDHGCITVMEHA